MENARLLTETREALDRQTATADVPQAINSSPGDLEPVFGAILEKAHSLCAADYGALLTYDGERFRHSAGYGASANIAALVGEGIRPGPHNSFGELLQGAPLIHIHDMAEWAARSPDDPLRGDLVKVGGIRTQLIVPLRKDSRLLGVITANRTEVRPFSDKQIALLQSFAAQAVIAMDNARLLTETREALDQQTATADVLGVINSLPGDLAPVFNAMLEKAMHLCGAAFGILWTRDGDRFRPTAHSGLPARFAEFLEHDPPAPEANPGSGHARILAGERLIHVADGADEELYQAGDPYRARFGRSRRRADRPDGATPQRRDGRRVLHDLPPGGAAVL